MYSFSNVQLGSYKVEVNRLGFSPSVVTVNARDTSTSIVVRLVPLPQELATTVVSETRARLPRVYERKEKHLGHVLFAEDLPKYQAFDVSDLFNRVPRFYALLASTRSCRGAMVFVDGLPLPPETGLDEYVRPSEVAAIEVHASADFLHEDFLKFPPEVVASSAPQMLGTIRLGRAPPKLSQGLTGTCKRIVMIWTWWYKSR